MKAPDAPVASLTVTTVADAYVDMFAPSTGLLRRAEPGQAAAPLQAGHGSAFLVDCRHGGGATTLLIDGGLSPGMLLGNLKALGRRPGEIDGIILTHGHPDHYQGLWGLLPELRPGRPFYVHPGAFAPRVVSTPRGEAGPWSLDRSALAGSGVVVTETASWTRVAGGVHLTGGLPEDSVPAAEMPGSFVLAGDERLPDRVVDEMAVVFDLGPRGLVLLTACAHRWAPAVARHVSRRLGKGVFGLIAGFHMSRAPAGAVERLARELAELDLEFILSGHCTGFEASAILRGALGERFLVNTVGSRLELQGGAGRPRRA